MALDFFKREELEKIKELESLLEKYKPIIDLDATIREKELLINNFESTIGRYTEIAALNEKIRSSKIALDSMIHEKELQINNFESTIGRFTEIADLNKRIKSIKSDYEIASKEKRDDIDKLQSQYQELKTKYSTSKETYAKLRNEISVYENKLDLIEFGVYEPIYDFEKSDEYREEQGRMREKQKNMLYAETAAKCSINWTIDGSVAKGTASTKRLIKLTLRAFNGESDSLIAKVKWNNVNQLKERIRKSFEAINKLAENNAISISHEYYNLKLKELILEYEYQAKKQQEKEEMRAIQEELREEEKARREFEKVQREAEKEESLYSKALEKVQKELGLADTETQFKLQEQISLLEAELEEARLRKERALSMAQQTKRGHLYIISNIGSFGEDVYKIGMTRRLEPLDRVRELGDASVPFKFDVHALIYSDEARTLEYELHKAFSEKKVNMLNYRREFFKVTLEEIEAKIKELGFKAEFSTSPEAMEYRETQLILDKIRNGEALPTLAELVEEEFPSEI